MAEMNHGSLTMSATFWTLSPLSYPAKLYRTPRAVTFLPFVVLNFANLFPPTGVDMLLMVMLALEERYLPCSFGAKFL